ncbi:MAG: formylglycine-generating enzyme family protein [Planctomycetota bacterium]|nr:formylglycine-generating enzyme family protein [Planctomycetota bacterium]
MGSPLDETGRFEGGGGHNEQEHEVTLSKDFYLGVREVTRGEWKAVMETEPWKVEPQAQKEPGDYPATCVSFDDAVSFCWNLSGKEGREYRLPTEAEWEYACRAGTTTAYSFGDSRDDLTKYAWFDGNTQRDTRAERVGAKLPNPWGLYDMHGNVYEWCQDWHGDYPSVAVTDPQGAPEGLFRVLRGGGWTCGAAWSRAAYRYGNVPTFHGSKYYGDSTYVSNTGFRLALSPSAKQPEANESK